MTLLKYWILKDDTLTIKILFLICQRIKSKPTHLTANLTETLGLIVMATLRDQWLIDISIRCLHGGIPHKYFDKQFA